MMATPCHFLVTCEHASATVPPRWEALLLDFVNTCEEHEIWDPGTREIGAHLGRLLGAPLFRGEFTRLLVDLNRSINHPNLFSPPIQELPPSQKTGILLEYYYPFRHEVAGAIEQLSSDAKPILHLSVHSFTPRFNGEERTGDIGILFDPSRECERELANVWLYYLTHAAPEMRCKANYPYAGVSDGHVTALRRAYNRKPYIGIELELNQALPVSNEPDRFARLCVKTLQRALQNKRVQKAIFGRA